MKETLHSDQLPTDALFFGCSSHEERCLGVVRNWGRWRPVQSVLFHYDDLNPKRETNHAELLSSIKGNHQVMEVSFTEKDAVAGFRGYRDRLNALLQDHGNGPIVVDISVLTKRHLLMLLRWLDDHECMSRLWVLYCEPEDYEVKSCLPLSFGVSRIEPVPGFSAAPDPSRPLHVAMFLGYEGDRAFATYEILQPRKTSLIVPCPAYRPEWEGRTELLNGNLLSVVGTDGIRKADSLDPESSRRVLEEVFGPVSGRSDASRVICPLGTKPQAFGAYQYIRDSADPPAIIYTASLRHNHNFYSRGVGHRWIIYRPT
jgi:hypothetical protein